MTHRTVASTLGDPAGSGISRIARPHPDEHRLMCTARVSRNAHEVSARTVLVCMRFEPSNPVIDVGHRTWITRVGRHAEIQRRNNYTALRERFVDRLIHRAVVVAPRA